MKKSKFVSVLMVMMMIGMCFSGGCRKPYNKEIFQEIESYETAFVIPLEGDVSDQVVLGSVDELRAMQVEIKRIPIPQRFHQTGRRGWQGEWIPTVRVITVDRRPITREWTADANSGTNQRNEAIWIESADSIEFSVGFTCTAYIDKPGTADFLYQYSSQSLAETMDSEIRAQIQSRAAEVASQYNLSELRARKQEIIDAVRVTIIPFFAERGITITTVGMFGGLNYKNQEIQDAIDAVFRAQTDEETALAELAAQRNRNQTIELAAEAAANAVRIKAQGEADAINSVTEAIDTSGDIYLAYLGKMNRRAEISQWDGAYPRQLWNMTSGGGGGGVGVLVSTPALGDD